MNLTYYVQLYRAIIDSLHFGPGLLAARQTSVVIHAWARFWFPKCKIFITLGYSCQCVAEIFGEIQSEIEVPCSVIFRQYNDVHFAPFLS